MNYKWMYIKEGTDPKINALSPEMKQFGVPETEDDFFVHLRMFDGSGEEAECKNISCLYFKGVPYPSLNELIEKTDKKRLHLRQKMTRLREFLRASYEEVKRGKNG